MIITINEIKTKYKDMKLKRINESTMSGDTHFAIHKQTGLCVFSWDYSDEDPEDLRSFKNDYFFIDLKDNGFNPKMFKIVTSKRLKGEPVESNTGIFPCSEEYEMQRNGEDFWELAHEKSPETFINESIYKNNMKQRIRLSESSLYRIIKESVRRVLNETRFGTPKYVEGRKVNGKSGNLISDNGKGSIVAVLDNLHFLGNSITGENRETRKKETLFIVGLFGRPVDGFTLPSAHETPNGLAVTHLMRGNEEGYYLLDVDEYLMTPEFSAEWDYKHNPVDRI